MTARNQPPPGGGPDVPPARLFTAFLRLGLTAFGGPTTVAYIRELAVRKKGWLTAESFDQGLALAQSIPGSTAMQTSAYVGFRAGGPIGSLAAFGGFVLPAFILMVALSAAHGGARDLHAVTAAFRGLHLIVVALVAYAAFTFGLSGVRDLRDVLIAAGAAVFLGFGGNPIIAVAAASVVGLFLYRGVSPPDADCPDGRNNGGHQPLRFPVILASCLAAGLVVLYFVNYTLADLAATMMKVNIFAFGGGFAAVPLMHHEVVEARHWMDSRTFMDGIALGQVTPGPVIITATFVGYQVGGAIGAVVGTVGIFAPSALMIITAVPYLDRLRRSRLFPRVVRAITAAFVGLLVAIGVNFGAVVSWTALSVILAAGAFIALRLKIDVLWVILAGALVSASAL